MSNSLLELQRDPVAFRKALLIDTDSGPRPFADCMDPWQDTDFRALDSGWQRAVIGSKASATHQRGWLERGRGASKTSDLAVMVAWALFASRRRLSGIGASGDQDQARLLRDSISRLLYINPWLAKILEVQAYRVLNTKTQSTLEIITSDAPTSYGLTPDFIVCDEVTHWRKRDLWDSLISSAAKRSTCMVVCITNAGLQADWQWHLREAVRNDPTWYFSRLLPAQVSWITPDRLQEQERLLPSIAYRRLWLNEWTSGGGDALTPEDIQAAFLYNARPQSQALSGFEYVGGLDLGVSRDASALCILGVHRGASDHGRICLAHTRVWRPHKGSKINLQDIEDAILDLSHRFRLKALNYDPWEARHMAQRLSAIGIAVADKHLPRLNRETVMPARRVPMTEVTPTGKNLQAIATAVIEAFNDRRIELYEDPDLHRDLTRLRVEERQYGFRLTSPRDEYGHGDLGTAFSLAMLAASELAGRRIVRLQAGDGGDGSPFARALQSFQREQIRYQRDQERLAGPDDHQDPFRQLMQRTGRISSGYPTL